MKWYVINLRKHKTAVSFFTIGLALILAVSISVGAVGKVYRNELFITAASDINNEKIVIVDAGHGGEDGGASGFGGALEKDIALSLAFEIGACLEERGYAVVYTRTEDKLLYKPEEDIKGIRKISDLKNRCEIANLYPDAPFISVHMNSFGDSKYSGLQVYYSKNNELSHSLANSVQNTVRDSLQTTNNRTTKVGENIYVLKNINNPAILIECGFLTNEEECKKLLQKEYQKQLSFSIVCGIIDVIE